MLAYLKNLLLAIDRFLAAVLFNRPDITISALCWVVDYATTDRVAGAAYEALALAKWQVLLLAGIGKVLWLIQPSHMTIARQTELTVAGSTITLLGEKVVA